MGRGVEFVVLWLHGWLGMDWFVGGRGEWGDGLEVLPCDQHCFLFEDGFALYGVDGFRDESTEEGSGTLDLIYWWWCGAAGMMDIPSEGVIESGGGGFVSRDAGRCWLWC